MTKTATDSNDDPDPDDSIKKANIPSPRLGPDKSDKIRDESDERTGNDDKS